VAFTELDKQAWVGPAYAAYPLTDGPRFGSVDTTPRIKRASAANGLEQGIIEGESAAQDDHVALVYSGHREITLGDTITPGQYAETDNVGRAVPYTASSGHYAMGIMVRGGAVGEIGEIILDPGIKFTA
jgi:hypothetical protein